LLVGWFITPSAVDPSENIVLRVLAFLDGFFLFCFGGLFALSLASPLIAHFILPLVITLLEVVRVLLLFIQYLIDKVLIEPLIHWFLYRIRQKDTRERPSGKNHGADPGVAACQREFSPRRRAPRPHLQPDVAPAPIPRLYH